ncbi:uncharacterized protein VTP21DRAFT_11571 [Calcarisporiella thermophila]|uniref:uncharacterized protein n=1 Tax=Calcarisporiella thermophila TaxID=911321 RepID=UPI003743F03D
MRSLNVILKVLPGSLLATLWATLLTCLFKLAKVTDLAFPPTFITSVSMVISLILVFRTNTAYDRYWEGRRLWSTVNVSIRNFARIVWVNIKEPTPEDVLLKKTVLNLLLAFAVATKHYLREEFGIDYDDLRHLIHHIPNFDTPAAIKGQRPLLKKRSGSSFTILSSWKNFHEAKRMNKLITEHLRHEGFSQASNLPYEITLYLSSYVQDQRNRDLADVPSTTNLHNALTQLTDCLTGFERIRRTPIPLAYTVHLTISIWVFVFLLPFQLLSSLVWATIPITFAASFILLGIESIGAEIENPFGYDDNDLPLDEYCDIIKQELDAISSRPPPTNLYEWAFSKANKLFETSPTNAKDLTGASMEQVRRMLEAEGPTARRNSVAKYPLINGNDEEARDQSVASSTTEEFKINMN